MALDRYGRRIHYLRISLTDHCNLRCLYCMPDDITFRPNAELMQDDEILRLVRLFAGLGFDKFRLTGGEPTVRADIVDLVRGIAHTPGVRSLSMTTNGVLFARLARPLAEAGLQRVNFSLDTLDPEKFDRLTRRGRPGRCLGGHPGGRRGRADADQDQCGGGARLQRRRCDRPGAPDPGQALAGALHRNDALCRRDRIPAHAGGQRRRNPGAASRPRWARWNRSTAASWMARRACSACQAHRGRLALSPPSPSRFAPAAPGPA